MEFSLLELSEGFRGDSPAPRGRSRRLLNFPFLAFPARDAGCNFWQLTYPARAASSGFLALPLGTFAAATGNVLGLVLKQGFALVAAGMLAGGPGAFYLERLLRGLVFGISEVRAVAWIAAAAVLPAVTLAACHGPARRATRVDPAIALRYE